MGVVVGLVLAVWLGVAVAVAVWALRARHEQAVDRAAAEAASAAGAQVDLTDSVVDLTSLDDRVDADGDDARRA